MPRLEFFLLEIVVVDPEEILIFLEMANNFLDFQSASLAGGNTAVPDWLKLRSCLDAFQSRYILIRSGVEYIEISAWALCSWGTIKTAKMRGKGFMRCEEMGIFHFPITWLK
ncbi:hypothetical protein AVEN_232057-1 [Araneus ventricosus]|uniref:Uncharacterized protein n=1 Tax=Araneus ventricosus TaxID=182803 RepID=A0A4Y2EK97_ARAVE|nr:hypothetical protein AVEN_232057-1 [Araneus ventricosus]